MEMKWGHTGHISHTCPPKLKRRRMGHIGHMEHLTQIFFIGSNITMRITLKSSLPLFAGSLRRGVI